MAFPKQPIETFVCTITTADAFSIQMKTQKDAKSVKRIQITSPDVGEDSFIRGRTSLKNVSDTNYFSKIPNSLLWSFPYQEADKRGLPLNEMNVIAEGEELLLEGTLTAETDKILYITLFYE